MELKLQTSVVKTLTSKVVKGMGNNKMLPITEMIGINIENNVLSFVSTDGKNTVQSHFKLEEPTENISFAINGNSFAKLVQKTTTESVTLSIEEDKTPVDAKTSSIAASIILVMTPEETVIG